MKNKTVIIISAIALSFLILVGCFCIFWFVGRDFSFGDETNETVGSENVDDANVDNSVSGNDEDLAETHTLTPVAATAATCTSTGNKAYWVCVTCEKLFADENGKTEITDERSLTISALGHNYFPEYIIDEAATCTKEGSKSRHCTRCDSTTDVTSIDMTTHSWSNVSVKTIATCTTKWKVEYTCSVCSATKEEELAALGHNYSTEYIVDEEATCAQAGTKSKRCTRCGSAESVTTIEMVAHSWNDGEVKTAATCTAKGVTIYTCSVCSATREEELLASGHNLQEIEAKSATCKDAGNSAYFECANCNKYFEDEDGTTEIVDRSSVIIPATTDHNYDEDGICLVCGIESDFTFDYYGTVVTVTGYKGSDTDLTIPSAIKVYGRQREVTAIAASAFSDNTALTSVDIPSTVASIGSSAFSGCTGLTAVNYNAKNCADLTQSSNAFANIGTSGNGLTINIGDNVEYIPAYLFYNCTNVTKVNIGKGVTAIGNYSFYNGKNLTEINFYAKNCADTSGGNTFYNAGVSSEGLTVTIGDNVEYIPGYLFMRCSGLTCVTIGNSVTEIGKYAFSSCTGLTEITIPDSVVTIDECAFSITVIQLPDETVTPTGIATLTLGSGVKTIAATAFSGCSNLKTVYYKGSAADWAEISITGSNRGEDYLAKATRYYYSETQPDADDGNYWHYDADGAIAVWVKDEQA